jgi:hypothetical protein
MRNDIKFFVKHLDVFVLFLCIKIFDLNKYNKEIKFKSSAIMPKGWQPRS